MRVFAYTTQALVKQVAVPAVGVGLPPPPVTLNGLRPRRFQGPVHPTGRAPRAGRPRRRWRTPRPRLEATRRPLRPVGYDGGHVVGLHLGGENDSRNVRADVPAV